MADETGLIRGQFSWWSYSAFTRTCHSEVFHKILKIIPTTRCHFRESATSCRMLRTEPKHQKTYTSIIFIPTQVSKALQEKTPSAL